MISFQAEKTVFYLCNFHCGSVEVMTNFFNCSSESEDYGAVNLCMIRERI